MDVSFSYIELIVPTNDWLESVWCSIPLCIVYTLNTQMYGNNSVNCSSCVMWANSNIAFERVNMKVMFPTLFCLLRTLVVLLPSTIPSVFPRCFLCVSTLLCMVALTTGYTEVVVFVTIPIPKARRVKLTRYLVVHSFGNTKSFVWTKTTTPGPDTSQD